MELLKKIFSGVRKTVALIPLFIGAGCYYLAEFIAGTKFTWRGQQAGQEAVFKMRMSDAQFIGRKGFRQPKRRR